MEAEYNKWTVRYVGEEFQVFQGFGSIFNTPMNAAAVLWRHTLPKATITSLQTWHQWDLWLPGYKSFRSRLPWIYPSMLSAVLRNPMGYALGITKYRFVHL